MVKQRPLYDMHGNEFYARSLNDLRKCVNTNTDHDYRFDLKNAPALIRKAIANQEHITIVGDYDCDGIMATSILVKTFEALGVPYVDIKDAFNQSGPTISYRVPLRFTEGYGMNPSMVDEIESGLVITVDNGIAALDAIEKAKAKGLQVIVTDHHQPVIEKIDNVPCMILPPADCVIDPHVEEIADDESAQKYDYYDYCGAGVALKLAESLLGKDHPEISKLYPFAAIATVADVMPLTEDNRNIFIRGVNEIAAGNMTNGLYYLIVGNNIQLDEIPGNIRAIDMITSETFGFKIGPCLNALSRLLDEGARYGVMTMMEENQMDAIKKGKSLLVANERRKNIQAVEFEKIAQLISDEGIEDDIPLVVHFPESGDGFIGLHAGKLCEALGVPVIVLNGPNENGLCKGSCRSPVGVNMKELLDETAEYIHHYGGHAGAAGLSMKKDNIDAFRNALKTICKERSVRPVVLDYDPYDIEITASQIPAALQLIRDMVPFGTDNPAPSFLIKDFKIKEARALKGDTLKLVGYDGTTAIGFHMCQNGGVPRECAEGQTIALIGQLGYNVFKGSATPQISIQCVVDGRELIHEKSEDIDR